MIRLTEPPFFPFLNISSDFLSAAFRFIQQFQLTLNRFDSRTIRDARGHSNDPFLLAAQGEHIAQTEWLIPAIRQVTAHVAATSHSSVVR